MNSFTILLLLAALEHASAGDAVAIALDVDRTSRRHDARMPLGVTPGRSADDELKGQAENNHDISLPEDPAAGRIASLLATFPRQQSAPGSRDTALLAAWWAVVAVDLGGCFGVKQGMPNDPRIEGNESFTLDCRCGPGVAQRVAVRLISLGCLQLHVHGGRKDGNAGHV